MYVWVAADVCVYAVCIFRFLNELVGALSHCALCNCCARVFWRLYNTWMAAVWIISFVCSSLLFFFRLVQIPNRLVWLKSIFNIGFFSVHPSWVILHMNCQQFGPDLRQVIHKELFSLRKFHELSNGNTYCESALGRAQLFVWIYE